MHGKGGFAADRCLQCTHLIPKAGYYSKGDRGMRRGNIFLGIILILAGGVYLLDNLGILNVDFWGVLWALVIIGFGFWLLIGIVSGERGDTTELTVPLDGAFSTRLILRHGAGSLSLIGGASEGQALSGTFVGGVDSRSKKSAGSLEVTLEPQRGFLGIFPFSGPNNWSILLNEEVPISLDVKGGASETTMNLSNVKVTDLYLQTGASSTTLVLPAGAGFTKARVESGAASVSVQVPEGVAASINTSSGLSEIRVDQARFPRSGGRYQSADYDSAENKVELYLSMGVGSIDVR
jgi:hypothetical protein